VQMTRARIRALALLAAVVPLGFGLKYYHGPGGPWVRNSLAGAAYEMFWCLALFAIWPRRRAIMPIVAGVLAVTCVLETLQLWHPPWLEAIRGTFPGRALLGTTYQPSDFIYYVIGCGLGWMVLHFAAQGETRCAHESST
jgi:hypothetical protein